MSADVIALTVALQRNIPCIMVYKRSLGALAEETRRGNDESREAKNRG